MAEVFECFREANTVHFDISPTNICINLSESTITDIKIVDFGCGFSWAEDVPVHLTGLEYRAPEVLQYFEKAKK